MPDRVETLSKTDGNDPTSAEHLLPLVYNELRRLAAAKLAQEMPGHTLQATALVHEAYLRLAGSGQDQKWQNRGHFFTAAAEAMRRILVENARSKGSLKRGGLWKRKDLSEAHTLEMASPDELLALEDALERLASEDPLKAELVKLRYFAGLSHREATDALGLSRATADRYWAYAKVFLYSELFEPCEPGSAREA